MERNLREIAIGSPKEINFTEFQGPTKDLVAGASELSGDAFVSKGLGGQNIVTEASQGIFGKGGDFNLLKGSLLTDPSGKLKKGTEIIGNKCKAVVTKNRMGPPQRQAEFDIYYDSGIADYASWIKVMKENKLVTQGGAYYTYKPDNGEPIKFQSKDFVNIMESDQNLKNEVYKKICECVIMEYKDPNSKIVEDAIVSTDEDVGINEENN